MLKKLGCFVLALGLSVSALCINTFAVDYNDTTYQILAQKYDELNKAKFNTYNYKFKYNKQDGYIVPYLSKPDFDGGVLGGAIDDFDNDNQYELLVFDTECNVDSTVQYPDDITNSIEIHMYELISGEVKLVDKSSRVYGVLYGNGGGTECFIKNVGNKKYIVMQNTYEDNVFSDGAYYDIKIIEYNGKSLNQEFEYSGAGSVVHISESEASNFKNLGFAGTYNYLREDNSSGGGEYAFSPYFYFFNLAKLENNIEKIVEILITNNSEKNVSYGNTSGAESVDVRGEAVTKASKDDSVLNMAFTSGNYNNVNIVKSKETNVIDF